jgi:hypothetical protein
VISYRTAGSEQGIRGKYLSEDCVKNYSKRLVIFVCAVLLLGCGFAAAQDKSANVTGTWTVSVTGHAGNAEQTIVLKQDGSKITGTFKGPRQSGPLEGTVDGNNISFHVATRVPLDYKGTIDGDTMKGTLTGHGKTGDWTAKRAK